MSETKTVDSNLKMEIKDNKLCIEIDLDKNEGHSKSGKSVVVASTHGNAMIAGGFKVGVNIYRPLSKDKRVAPRTEDAEGADSELVISK